MATREQADAVRGRTIRLIWNEGPTKGKAYDHAFHPDGTVEWRDAGLEKSTAGKPAVERPPYGAVKVADDIYLVSYLAPSGYTLTVTLNFRDRSVAGFASGAKEWYPLKGTLEVLR